MLDRRARVDRFIAVESTQKEERNALSQIVWALVVNRETKTFRFSSLHHCWGRREKERGRERERDRMKKKTTSHVSHKGVQVFRRAVTVSSSRCRSLPDDSYNQSLLVIILTKAAIIRGGVKCTVAARAAGLSASPRRSISPPLPRDRVQRTHERKDDHFVGRYS